MPATQPFRPAREIAIAARKLAAHDPANYDPGPAAPAVDPLPTQRVDVVEFGPRRPRWWWGICLALAAAALTGLILFALGELVVGLVLVSAVVLGWCALWLFFPPTTTYRGRHRGSATAAGRESGTP